MLTAIFFSIYISFKTDLEQIELYQKYSIDNIWKIDDSFLACSRFDSTIFLMDIDGVLKKIYNKKGEGPRELNRPNLLSISDSKIFMRNLNGSIIEFDHKLNAVEISKIPPYPLSSSYSMPIYSDNMVMCSYITFPIGNEKLVYKYELSENSWKNTGLYFDQKIPVHKRGRIDEVSQIKFDNKIAFYMPDGLMDANYEIHVYDFSIQNEEKPLTVLSQYHDAKEKTATGNYLVFDSGSVLKNGYLIEVRYLIKGDWFYFHDYFDKEGKFKKRKAMGSDIRLIPVQNSDEIFIFRDFEEGPILELFTPQM